MPVLLYIIMNRNIQLMQYFSAEKKKSIQSRNFHEVSIVSDCSRLENLPDISVFGECLSERMIQRLRPEWKLLRWEEQKMKRWGEKKEKRTGGRYSGTGVTSWTPAIIPSDPDKSSSEVEMRTTRRFQNCQRLPERLNPEYLVRFWRIKPVRVSCDYKIYQIKMIEYPHLCCM